MKMFFKKNAIMVGIICGVLIGYSQSQEVQNGLKIIKNSDQAVNYDNNGTGKSISSLDESVVGTESSASGVDQYYSVSAEAFFPGASVRYVNTYGMGGAYIQEQVKGALVAHVHLPHNAVVKEFKVHFNDNSAKDLDVYLEGLRFNGGAFYTLASVNSSGISGYGSKATTAINNNPINNTTYGYLIYAWCAPWDDTGNLRIMGATITYTISTSAAK